MENCLVTWLDDWSQNQVTQEPQIPKSLIAWLESETHDVTFPVVTTCGVYCVVSIWNQAVSSSQPYDQSHKPESSATLIWSTRF